MKGHLTRKITSAAKAVTDASAAPASHALQELTEMSKQIQSQYSKIEEGYTKLMDLDNGRYDVYDSELTAESAKVDRIMGSIRGC